MVGGKQQAERKERTNDGGEKFGNCCGKKTSATACVRQIHTPIGPAAAVQQTFMHMPARSY
jgi:hypothetical protein